MTVERNFETIFCYCEVLEKLFFHYYYYYYYCYFYSLKKEISLLCHKYIESNETIAPICNKVVFN